jgi:hypothetical protein
LLEYLAKRKKKNGSPGTWVDVQQDRIAKRIVKDVG